jgi:hypothetical protein
MVAERSFRVDLVAVARNRPLGGSDVKARTYSGLRNHIGQLRALGSGATVTRAV